MEILLVSYSLLLGGIVGSFAGVVIYRLHHDQSGIFLGRSKCPECQHALSWYHLIPVLSWCWQRGRCVFCQKWISVFYPGLEIAMALVFAIMVSRWWEVYNAWELIFWLVMWWFLVVLWFYDWRYLEVDRYLSWPAIGLALGWAIYTDSFLLAAGGALLGWGFYAVQYYASGKRWVGAGDLELGVLLGLLLGYERLFMVFFVAYIMGSVVGLYLICRGRAGAKTALPMGAFLLPALLLSLYHDQNWWVYYQQLFF